VLKNKLNLSVDYSFFRVFRSYRSWIELRWIKEIRAPFFSAFSVFSVVTVSWLGFSLPVCVFRGYGILG